LALKYGIDRQDLVEKILSGHGRVGNDHPIGPAYRYYAANLEQRTYDPERARYHLKQAGLDSVQVSLSAADAAFAGAVDAAILFKEHASKAGIDIAVVREPNDGYWSNVWMQKPFSAVFWRGRPTEDWMFSTVYASGAPWNDTFWDNSQFNDLLAAARVELDESKRREMYYQLQQLVRDDGGAVIPMFANYVSASSSKVRHHEHVAASDDLDGMRLTERWWFAE
jgi:peptide/nickel transport system substrate-binding protein